MDIDASRYDDLPLGEAVARYFADNGFPADGGYDDPLIPLMFGPIPLAFPNRPSRRRAVPFHDLHHIVTGYQTDLVGEAEIGAWEVASGCRDLWMAWVLNLLAMSALVFRAPLRTLRAFSRGRQTKNLYGGDHAQLLSRSAAEVRQELGLDRSYPVRLRDVLLFIVVVHFAWLLGLASLPFAPLVVLQGWLHARRAEASVAA